MTTPLRILLSDAARESMREPIAQAMGGRAHTLVAATPGVDFDVAFVSRDVTGLSTRHTVLPETQYYYDLMCNAPSLQWVQLHSAGADRPVFLELRDRGVTITTSSGANASVVVQTALAVILAMARHVPQLMAQQQRSHWASLIATGLPRDITGQRAVMVGWGPIGRMLGGLLQAVGMSLAVARSSATPAAAADVATVAFEDLATLADDADWLILACPLSARTQGLVDRDLLARLPARARVVNIARGEVVDESALIDALRHGRLAGAYLDVFAHEPLPVDSPLWTLPNVIVTPHSAGFSDGNSARVAEMFTQNLARWNAGQPLVNLVS